VHSCVFSYLWCGSGKEKLSSEAIEGYYAPMAPHLSSSTGRRRKRGRREKGESSNQAAGLGAHGPQERRAQRQRGGSHEPGTRFPFLFKIFPSFA
jgi:hypothetical protein